MVLLSYCDVTIYQLYIKMDVATLKLPANLKSLAFGPSEFCETKHDLFQTRG